MEKSLVKALRLIELLANSDGPRGVTDIAAELGLQKSNVHRMLTTLCEESYVVRFDLGPAYQLNYKLFELGTRMATHLRLSDVARPFLRSIAQRTGEKKGMVSMSIPLASTCAAPPARGTSQSSPPYSKAISVFDIVG